MSSSKPIRRTLFKKSAYAKPISTGTADADDLFNRSKDLFSSVVREQEREAEERRIAKLQQARDAEERKRRRSSPSEGKPRKRRSESSSDDDEDRTPKHTMRTSPTSTPRVPSTINITDDASPVSKSPRNAALVRTDSQLSSTTSPQPAHNAIILSDSEDDDVSYVKTRQPSAPVAEIAPILVADEEEYPELLAAARARALAQARKKTMAERVAQRMAELRAGNTTAAKSSSIAPDPTYQPPPADPVIEFFISSEMPNTEPMIVRRKLSQSLREVKLAWCDKQSIDGRPMTIKEKDAIFLTWRGHKLFDSSTGAGLPGIRSDAQGIVRGDSARDGLGFHEGKVWLQAWTLRDFEEWKERVAKEKARVLAGLGDETPPSLLTTAPVDCTDPSRAVAPVEEKIRIILSAKDLPEVKVTVKSSTKVEQIVSVFKKRSGIDAGKRVVLRFDGDELEESMTVEDVDIDDMSKIDVYVS